MPSRGTLALQAIQLHHRQCAHCIIVLNTSHASAWEVCPINLQHPPAMARVFSALCETGNVKREAAGRSGGPPLHSSAIKFRLRFSLYFVSPDYALYHPVFAHPSYRLEIGCEQSFASRPKEEERVVYTLYHPQEIAISVRGRAAKEPGKTLAAREKQLPQGTPPDGGERHRCEG